MKKISLFLLVSLLSLVDGKAQDRYSYQFASDSSNAMFGSLVLDEFGLELHTLLTTGLIHFYSDTNFQHHMELDNAKSFFYLPKMMQIINPENPDDPYDLIDTMIYEYESPYEWFLIRTGTKHVELVSHPGQRVFLRKKDLETIEQSRLVIAVVEANPNTLIQGDNFGLYAKQFYDDLQWKVYKAFLDKNLNLYKGNKFNTIYSSKEKILFGVKRENWQIINPENPNDPYDLIDTVVTTPPNVEAFKSLLYMTSNQTNGNSKLLGISLTTCSRPLIAPPFITISSLQGRCNTCFGWIKIEDLEKALSKEDMYFIRMNYVWSMSHLNR